MSGNDWNSDADHVEEEGQDASLSHVDYGQAARNDHESTVAADSHATSSSAWEDRAESGPPAKMKRKLSLNSAGIERLGKVKKETRVGVATMLSFLILVTAFIVNKVRTSPKDEARGAKASGTTVAIKYPPENEPKVVPAKNVTTPPASPETDPEKPIDEKANGESPKSFDPDPSAIMRASVDGVPPQGKVVPPVSKAAPTPPAESNPPKLDPPKPSPAEPGKEQPPEKPPGDSAKLVPPLPVPVTAPEPPKPDAGAPKPPVALPDTQNPPKPAEPPKPTDAAGAKKPDVPPANVAEAKKPDAAPPGSPGSAELPPLGDLPSPTPPAPPIKPAVAGVAAAAAVGAAKLTEPPKAPEPKKDVPKPTEPAAAAAPAPAQAPLPVNPVQPNPAPSSAPGALPALPTSPPPINSKPPGVDIKPIEPLPSLDSGPKPGPEPKKSDEPSPLPNLDAGHGTPAPTAAQPPPQTEPAAPSPFDPPQRTIVSEPAPAKLPNLNEVPQNSAGELPRTEPKIRKAMPLEPGWTTLKHVGRSKLLGESELEPPAAKQVIPDAPPPRREIVTKEEIEPVLHKVQRGENFWTISRLYYGSGRYYRALWTYNRSVSPRIEELYVGTTIKVPPPEVLDRSLIEAPSLAASAKPAPAPKTTRPPQSDSEVRTVPARRTRSGSGGDLSLGSPVSRANAEDVDSPVRPTYRVRANDTLRGIAKQTLGDAKRDREILELNRGLINDPRNLTPGQTLILPEDARIATKVR